MPSKGGVMPASLDALEGASEARPLFVERRFILGSRDEFKVTFCPPEAVSPRLWRCVYRTEQTGIQLAHHAYGLDGMQALLLAMEKVHQNLRAEAAYRESASPLVSETSVVTWMGQRDLGLPMPGTVDTAVLRVSLLADAKIGGGDLDLIILGACTSQYRKVARIAGSTLDAIGARCSSARIFGEMGDDEPDLLLETVLSRLECLIDAGVLESQGDRSEPRYSEIRSSGPRA